MTKMYRCPCYNESHTEEEYNDLKENENCHKYCKTWDCYENPNDFELFFLKEKEDELREMRHYAQKYGYVLTLVTPHPIPE